MSESAPAAPLSLQDLPLFPLQTVLFPGGWLPLRIFEVRYLDMIKRCHAAGAPFGVVCLSEGSEVRRPDPNKPDGLAQDHFYHVGTLAHIEQLTAPQAGLLLVQARGQQRFRITASHLLPHGLWVADVTLDAAEPVIAVPEYLSPTREILQQVLAHLREREPQAVPEQPTQLLGQWDDSGWVANRWAELLPLTPELKHRLMALDNPLLRLELVSDVLDRLGV